MLHNSCLSQTAVKNCQNLSYICLGRFLKNLIYTVRLIGAKINKQKSEIVCVGYGELSDVETEQFGLQVCKDAIQLLGVYVGPNKSLCDDMNWKNKIKKVRSLLNMWLQRQLTLQGRVTVVNTLMLSRFWYALFVTSMPEWAYVEIKIMCKWRGEMHGLR